MACLLKNEPASYALWQVKQLTLWSRSESESEQGAKSEGVDPKPRELSMVSVKRA
jgi:hypothetical protein